MSADVTHIAWLDLETTGLEPNLGEILEIGIVLTDTDLNTVAEWAWLVLPKQLDVLALHPVVREMHTANGLIREITLLNEKRWEGYLNHGYDIAGREREVEEWLRLNVADIEYGKTVALGGSGVSHFDVRWLQHHAPTLAKLFYRSTEDVGVIRRFITDVVKRPELVPPETRNLNHRALDDARQHLAEARHYRKLFGAIAETSPRLGAPRPHGLCGSMKRWEWGWDSCDLAPGHAGPLHEAGAGMQRRRWRFSTTP